MLSLLWEHFWWPGMTDQVQKSLRSCMCCLQHKGNLSKAPLHQILSTAPMDLLHIDFTSIETTMELNILAKVVNVLVFQDHFTKHAMVYVTPNQTAKTVTKFFVPRLHLHLSSSSQGPKQLWCELHEQHYWWDMQTPWHDEAVKHTLSPPDKWAGREVPSNYHADDWEVGRRW